MQNGICFSNFGNRGGRKERPQARKTLALIAAFGKLRLPLGKFYKLQLYSKQDVDSFGIRVISNQFIDNLIISSPKLTVDKYSFRLIESSQQSANSLLKSWRTYFYFKKISVDIKTSFKIINLGSCAPRPSASKTLEVSRREILSGKLENYKTEEIILY